MDKIIFQAEDKEKVTPLKQNINTKGTPSYNIVSSNKADVLGLINAYLIDNATKDNLTTPTIHVGEVLGSVSFLYEKARNAIDYKGEHLLRRNAIERILKRNYWVNSRQGY